MVVLLFHYFIFNPLMSPLICLFTAPGGPRRLHPVRMKVSGAEQPWAPVCFFFPCLLEEAGTGSITYLSPDGQRLPLAPAQLCWVQKMEAAAAPDSSPLVGSRNAEGNTENKEATGHRGTASLSGGSRRQPMPVPSGSTAGSPVKLNKSLGHC